MRTPSMPTTAKTTARHKGPQNRRRAVAARVGAPSITAPGSAQNHQRAVAARLDRKRVKSGNRDLSEARIVALALSEKLAKAGRQEIETQLNLGIPVTYQEGDEVIKHYPDGRKEILETI